MQLTGGGRAARTHSGPQLSPFTRTLLALAVITAPALGGVLPEERADVMYHYYNGGDITVDGAEQALSALRRPRDGGAAGKCPHHGQGLT